MKSFAELRLPESTRAIGKNEWLVQVEHTINSYWYCLLSDGSNELIAPMANTVTDTYTFNTLLEAFSVSIAFYELHNKDYPYIVEFQKEKYKNIPVPGSQLKSQPMVFK